MKKYLPYILLAILCIPLFFLNVPNAHSLGDDYAQYIKEADNISKGLPYYRSNYLFNSQEWEYAPPQYPPGFPLLLAPVVAVWGIAIKPMLYFNTVLLVCLGLSLFAYFRKYAGDITAVCMSLIVVYGNALLSLKGSVLSDLPCLLFVVLYLLARRGSVFSMGRIILLVCLATMVILIRSQGLLLLGAEGLYLFSFFIGRIRARQLTAAGIFASVSFKVIAGTVVLYII